MSPLVGESFASPPSLVANEISNLDAFHVWLQSQRPALRIKPTDNEFTFNVGLLCWDACALKSNGDRKPSATDVFAVEIKPKQGWDIKLLDNRTLKLFEIDESVSDKCRFCALQFIKLQDGRAKENSNYCPLELFSQ